MQRALPIGCLIVVFHGTSQARTQIHSFVFDGLSSDEASREFELPGLDPSRNPAELIAIELEVRSWTSLAHTFENPNPDPLTVSNVYSSFTTLAVLNIGAWLQTPEAALSSGTFELAGSDSQPNAGNDFATFAVDEVGLQSESAFTDAWILEAIRDGQSPLLATVSAAWLTVFDGVGDSHTGFEINQSGEFVVTYTFASVPTPTSCGGLLMAACWLRRRR